MPSVLVHIELGGGRPLGSSLTALAVGRRLASAWGARLHAAVIAPTTAPGDAASTLRIVTSAAAAEELIGPIDGLAEACARLGGAGADQVVVGLIDVAPLPVWSVVGGAWSAILDHLRPRLVLFGADAPAAADVAPRTAARLGARFLGRAQPRGGDPVELVDRDGTVARLDDPGVVVARIGGRARLGRGAAAAPLLVMAVPASADARVEVLEVVDLAPSRGAVGAAGAVVAIGATASPDDAAAARRLAQRLGAAVIGPPAARRAGLVDDAEVLDADAALSPALCVVVGDCALDLAGATSVIRVAGATPEDVDGELAALGPLAATGAA